MSWKDLLLPPGQEIRTFVPIGETEEMVGLFDRGGLSRGGIPVEEMADEAWRQFKKELSNKELHGLLQVRENLKRVKRERDEALSKIDNARDGIRCSKYNEMCRQMSPCDCNNCHIWGMLS